MTIIEGDCIEAMREMPEASMDAVVTDPPYGLGFMGKAWDSSFEAANMPMRRNGPQDAVNAGAARQGGRQRAGVDYQRRMARDSRDFQTWCETWATEALRVLKPGGHLLAFGGTRTYHRLVCAIEDAGFEIRDTIAWMYGSGFPKSLDVSKAIDKAAGAEREVLGHESRHRNRPQTAAWGASAAPSRRDPRPTGTSDGGLLAAVTAPATLDAEQWAGWGTALKPAFEPIVVARKPLAGTVSANVLAHGTGALNVDGCRIDGAPPSVPQPALGVAKRTYGHGTGAGRNGEMSAATGRWPANVVLDPEAAALLDAQTGTLASGSGPLIRNGDKFRNAYGAFAGGDESADVLYGDSGGASRFFYCAKTSSAERNAGLDGFEAAQRDGQSAWAGLCNVCGCRMMLYGKPTCGHDDFAWVTGKPTKNVHPTVKPIDLMRWLVRLVTPPGGTVLDPFAGSGTTGCAAALESFKFVGIEREAEYAAIADARIAWWATHPEGMVLVERLAAEQAQRDYAESGQLNLLADA